MSGGPRRPPVPGLIPLRVLSRRPGRSQRRPESIDADAASNLAETRAAAPDRRRHHHHHHHHRRRRNSSVGKQSRSSSSPPAALEHPAPRVNPIFVWVRQENTRIVDVKCEDYDKRNRILLTKTAHGWRAIPRTEMLTAPRASAEDTNCLSNPSASASSPSPETDAPASSSSSSIVHHHHHRHHHHHKRRSRKSSKVHQSTSVQFPDGEEGSNEPSWVTSENVNIESLLPSHTIQVKRLPLSNINKDDDEDLHKQSVNISAEQEFERRTPDKLCDVTPLENLLAVAELELKQHMQSGNWSDNISPSQRNDENSENAEAQLKSPDDDDYIAHNSEKSDDVCSYNDDDEMSMNDILSRLEQSLRSPHEFGSDDEAFDHDCSLQTSTNVPTETTNKIIEPAPLEIKEPIQEENTLLITNEKITDLECQNIEESKIEEILDDTVEEPIMMETHLDNQILPTTEEIDEAEHIATSNQVSPANDSIKENNSNQFSEAESSSVLTEVPFPTPEDTNHSICLDLSMKNKPLAVVVPKEDLDCGPTDLSIRKMQPLRPSSQSSETIQSPQPSGIPAVPASPDIVSTTSISKPRSIFLESLLSKAAAQNAELNLSKAKEPLDLGQNRKSASPTVTCSEEIITESAEPPAKKLKTTNITLKNLLDKDIEAKKSSARETILSDDTPRLLSLLKASSDTQDPLAEYKQILLELDIPNPLMVPKDVFPELLKHPRREILKILSGHSNKNVPLDDISVVYKDKLLAAIQSGNHFTMNEEKKHESIKSSNSNKHQTQRSTNESHTGETSNSKRKSSDSSSKSSSSLANDIDVANEAAAFNPFFWPNPFESMGNYSNHNELFQALYAASSMPYLPSQFGELHPSLQMMLGNKLVSPLGYPPIPPINFNNPIELNMWQEAMMQASMLKNKSPYETMVNPQKPNVQKKPQHQPSQNKYSPRAASGQTKNISSSSQHNQLSPAMHPAFSQNSLNINNQNSWPNPYLNMGGFPQTSNNHLSLDSAQFNPLFSHKNTISPPNRLSPTTIQKKSKESMLFSQYSEQDKRMHRQLMHEQQKMQQQKLLRQQQQQQQQQIMQQQQQQQHQQFLMQTGNRHSSLPKKTNNNFTKEHNMDIPKQACPVDLSGGYNMQTSKAQKSVGKTNNLVSSSRGMLDDIPEVGSTTGSIEDIQEGHAQLWHPLFGSQKNYSPWGLPSLTAIGE